MVARDLISIKRPAGEYLVNVNENDEMTKYDATRKCASYGAVLASITEKSDYDAIQDVLLRDHEDGRRWKAYHVALDIAKDNSSRIFPNGVAYDYEKHGVFYRDNVESDEDLCPSAMLFAENRTEACIWLYSWGCQGMHANFICFKPKKPSCWSAEALVEERGFGHEKSMYGAALGMFCMTVIAVLFAFNYRRRLQNAEEDMEKLCKSTI